MVVGSGGEQGVDGRGVGTLLVSPPKVILDAGKDMRVPPTDEAGLNFISDAARATGLAVATRGNEHACTR
jgi:hypothetical protein